MPQAQPELKKYLDKRVEVQLNGSRKVMGTLRGYDVFLNIVLDEATETKPNNEKDRGQSPWWRKMSDKVWKGSRLRKEVHIWMVSPTEQAQGMLIAVHEMNVLAYANNAAAYFQHVPMLDD